MGFLGTCLGTDLGTALGVDLAPRTLSFSKAFFVNASERYLLYGGLLTGPFAAYVPATRVISSRRYAQLERSNSTINSYSEELQQAYWSTFSTGVTCNANAYNSPLGSLTADFIEENAIFNYHWIRHPFEIGVVSAGSVVALSVFLKYKGRDWFSLGIEGSAFLSACYIWINMTTGQAELQGTPLWYRVTLCNDDYINVTLAYVTDQEGTVDIFGFLVDVLSGGVYQGVLDTGTICWGMNVVVTDILSSYIYANSSPATRAKDELYYPAASVPSWLRQGFTQHVVFNEYSSAMLTTDGGQKVLASFDATAETVTVYLDGADNRIHVGGSVSGQFVQSAVLSWSLEQHAIVKFQFDNGSNSVLTTSGFTTGDGVVTGTQAAAADGDVAHGMNHTTLDEQFDGLLAQLEPL